MAKRFLALYGFGLIGVIALLPMIAPTARDQYQLVAGELGVSYPLFLALTLINPAVLLAVGVMVGIRLAPGLGLRSHIDDRVRFGRRTGVDLRRELPLAVGLGLAGGAATIILDVVFQRATGALSAIPSAQQPSGLAALVGGMLYGGVAEELMTRWGLVTFLAWAAWRLTGRRGGAPDSGIFWGAIFGASVAFGAAHLPALAAAVPLTPILVVRTVFLNALAGVLFGWLFWRRSLEAAMIAHATFHIVFAGARAIM